MQPPTSILDRSNNTSIEISYIGIGTPALTALVPTPLWRGGKKNASMGGARRVATNRAKTLRIGAKYSTNRGLSAWPLTLSKNWNCQVRQQVGQIFLMVIKVIFARASLSACSP